MDSTAATPSTENRPAAEQAAMRVLIALSLAHMLNDILQALLPAIYPVLKENYRLSFTQIGLITFTYQLTSSLFQPVVGFLNDRRPRPLALAVGMTFTLSGLVLLSQATRFPLLLVAAALTGTGSSIFHPEASRLTRLASGGRHGFAQSLFQVGGNLGTSLGPLLAALVIGLRGQGNILWLSLMAVPGIVLLSRLGAWYRRTLERHALRPRAAKPAAASPLPTPVVVRTLLVLGVLVFSKFFYLAGITNYYTFYLMERFGLSINGSLVCLFVFLFASAAGTILGGVVGDRYGRRRVIWFSILGAAPFTLLLPHAGFAGTLVLSVLVGGILSSAFSAILVYAQELMPGRVGLVAGMFFGFAFGMAGLGSALLGRLADHSGLATVYQVCSYLPLLGLFTVLLPKLGETKTKRRG